MNLALLRLFFVFGLFVDGLSQGVKAPNKGNPDETSGFFEGDIIKGKRRMTSSNRTLKWTSNVIPYTIDPSFDDDSVFLAAMGEIEGHSCLVFSRLDEEAADQWPEDYLIFQNLTGCASSIGRQGGPQTVSIQTPHCAYKGIVMHEILHSLGFLHEHNRPDRDDYIKINWTNIDPLKSHHFQKYNKEEVFLFEEPYDYTSLLHVSSVFLAIDSNYSTLVPYPNDTIPIGQRSVLSSSDIKRLNAFYCQPETTVTTTTTTTTTTIPTTTTQSEMTTSFNIVCNSTTQFIPHPTDCSKFYVCSLPYPQLQSCPPNLLFNTGLNVCDWAWNVTCATATS